MNRSFGVVRKICRSFYITLNTVYQWRSFYHTNNISRLYLHLLLLSFIVCLFSLSYQLFVRACIARSTEATINQLEHISRSLLTCLVCFGSSISKLSTLVLFQQLILCELKWLMIFNLSSSVANSVFAVGREQMTKQTRQTRQTKQTHKRRVIAPPPMKLLPNREKFKTNTCMSTISSYLACGLYLILFSYHNWHMKMNWKSELCEIIEKILFCHVGFICVIITPSQQDTTYELSSLYIL